MWVADVAAKLEDAHGSGKGNEYDPGHETQQNRHGQWYTTVQAQESNLYVLQILQNEDE